MDAVNGKGFEKINFDQVTFIAIVDAKIRRNHSFSPFGPVFDHTEEEEEMLLTSDYYVYLTKHFHVKINRIHWICYYKRCWDLARVFKHVVSLRQSATVAQASFLKSIVNFACGYFGLNPSKLSSDSTRIAYSLPRRFNQSFHTINDLPSFDGNSFYLVTTHRKNRKLFSTHSPLPLFIGVIEFGKMRLNYIISFLYQYLRPNSFSILYSNVDNIVFACSKENIQDALKAGPVSQKRTFQYEWNQLTEDKTPGCLQEKWKASTGTKWEFVTPARMFYALKTENHASDTFKTCGLTGMTSDESFSIAMAILEKQTVLVTMDKRVNKLVDHSTHAVTFSL